MQSKVYSTYIRDTAVTCQSKCSVTVDLNVSYFTPMLCMWEHLIWNMKGMFDKGGVNNNYCKKEVYNYSKNLTCLAFQGTVRYKSGISIDNSMFNLRSNTMVRFALLRNYLHYNA